MIGLQALFLVLPWLARAAPVGEHRQPLGQDRWVLRDFHRDCSKDNCRYRFSIVEGSATPHRCDFTIPATRKPAPMMHFRNYPCDDTYRISGNWDRDRHNFIITINNTEAHHTAHFLYPEGSLDAGTVSPLVEATKNRPDKFLLDGR